jgi:hypothetical protein
MVEILMIFGLVCVLLVIRDLFSYERYENWKELPDKPEKLKGRD